MRELTYGIDSLAITGAVGSALAVSLFLGFRLGVARVRDKGDREREHVNAVQSAMLGLLALILGFSFSLSLQRFDERSQAVVEEAQALGAMRFQIALLPADQQGEAGRLLAAYGASRLAESRTPFGNSAQIDAVNSALDRLQQDLWQLALEAVRVDPSPLGAGSFLVHLGKLFDARDAVEATLHQHVPELIEALLFLALCVTGGVIGYASGLGGHRPSTVSYCLCGLVLGLTFVVLDLDRPRRGWIRVDLGSLEQTVSSLDAEAASPRPGARP